MDNPFSSLPGAGASIGKLAITDTGGAGGINISTQKRLELALAEPANPLALTQSQARKVTQNRIRMAMSELAHGKIDRVDAWLEEVAVKDPARAVELFLELAEYALPKLKAVTMTVTQNDNNVKTMTISQLEAIASGDDDSVVAEQ